MPRFRLAILAVAVASATLSSAIEAATDEERIRRLEAIVEKQQQMIEALTDEVRQLRGEQPHQVVVEELDGAEGDIAASEPASPAPEDPLEPLSVRIYGFAMADAIS